MLGAICGDILGSIYEKKPIKTTDFELFQPGCRFTDDTVLTVAIADAIQSRTGYTEKIRAYYHRYPNRGFGGRFQNWAAIDGAPLQDSFGNGSAMRVSPIGWAFDNLETVQRQAEQSCMNSHAHPEAVKGAQSIAAAVFLLRTGQTKVQVQQYIGERFGYNLDTTVDEIRPAYVFDVTCQGSVPQSIVCFLESHDYESAVRNAISLGGDSDTMACMAGALAEAHYQEVPEDITRFCLDRLDDPLMSVLERFNRSMRH